MNCLTLALALARGRCCSGAIFFGGLWWTVRKGVVPTAGAVVPRQPAAADGLALAGFYFVAGGDWSGWLPACSALSWRASVVMWLTRADQQRQHARRPAMRLSPDQMIFWQHGFLKLNGTIVFTWALMLVLAVGSKLVTRKLSTDLERSRWQNLLEIVVTGIEKQIEDVGLRHPEKYIGFLGTLFLFVARPASAQSFPATSRRRSLSTTAALALCVFVAVPFFGIEDRAWRLPQVLHRADGHHAAVQHHQRALAHAGAGRAPVRQHDERGDDHRASC